MTELETLERAKMYIEKLANGINPIDGSVIPDGDVANNVRLARCFFYVAGVLGQLVDKGGLTPQKKTQKEPFALSQEQKNAFQYSKASIPISELSKRINALADSENMETLSYRRIRDWLEHMELLEEVQNGDGIITKYPTAQGEKMGISLDARSGPKGTYFVVVYSMSAQHFILDHLEEIVAFMREEPENSGQAWTPEHDSCLLDLIQKGVPLDEIAVTLKRSKKSVHARFNHLRRKAKG